MPLWRVVVFKWNLNDRSQSPKKGGGIENRTGAKADSKGRLREGQGEGRRPTRTASHCETVTRASDKYPTASSFGDRDHYDCFMPLGFICPDFKACDKEGGVYHMGWFNLHDIGPGQVHCVSFPNLQGSDSSQPWQMAFKEAKVQGCLNCFAMCLSVSEVTEVEWQRLKRKDPGEWLHLNSFIKVNKISPV